MFDWKRVVAWVERNLVPVFAKIDGRLIVFVRFKLRSCEALLIGQCSVVVALKETVMSHHPRNFRSYKWAQDLIRNLAVRVRCKYVPYVMQQTADNPIVVRAIAFRARRRLQPARSQLVQVVQVAGGADAMGGL